MDASTLATRSAWLMEHSKVSNILDSWDEEKSRRPNTETTFRVVAADVGIKCSGEETKRTG